ncbi:MAG: YdcF family protein [Oscillospiraceae bacterium]|nr:YdcF family protein [Oscillospiraceae bacterium]
MRHFAVSFLSCIMAACCLTSCKWERIPQYRDPAALISELVCTYGRHADPAETAPILDSLTQCDSQTGALWTGIMDYWQQADMNMPYSKKHLPDSLPDDNTLCIAVLGYQLNPDGSMQNELIGRLRTALTCAEQYPEAVVLCTGGGTAACDRNATEAGQMAEWLEQHGLNPSRLLIENRSLTTAENARFSYQLIQKEQPQIKSVAIVTSKYHIPWGALMFETEFRLSAAENAQPAVHVDACCAYEIDRSGFDDAVNRSCQTAGMQYLIAAHTPDPVQNSRSSE